MRKITYIPVSSLEPVEFHVTEKEVTIEFLQALVSGYIERVPVRQSYNRKKATIWCNEEGRLIGLTHNRCASRLFGIELVGPVVIDQVA